MKPAEVHFRLINELTQYDTRQSKKKYYNRYALGQYFQAAKRVEINLLRGHDLRVSLLNCFCGDLLDKMLKAFKLELTTKMERLGVYDKLPEIDLDEIIELTDDSVTI